MWHKKSKKDLFHHLEQFKSTAHCFSLINDLIATKKKHLINFIFAHTYKTPSSMCYYSAATSMESPTEISQLVYTSIKETYKELPVAPTWAAEIIYLICYSTSSILISGKTPETKQKLIRTWPEAAA